MDTCGMPSKTWQVGTTMSCEEYRKGSYYDTAHVSRHNSIVEELLRDTIEGKRRQDMLTKIWLENIKERGKDFRLCPP